MKRDTYQKIREAEFKCVREALEIFLSRPLMMEDIPRFTKHYPDTTRAAYVLLVDGKAIGEIVFAINERGNPANRDIFAGVQFIPLNTV